MGVVAQSATRAIESTRAHVNDRIDRQTRGNIAYYAAHPNRIGERLHEIDREWDVERWLQVNSAVLSLLGLTLALRRGRHWLLLPAIVQGFFLQHAVQGWCPPLPAFRRLGVRTAAEIEQERHALKGLRGDFREAERNPDALEAAQL